MRIIVWIGAAALFGACSSGEPSPDVAPSPSGTKTDSPREAIPEADAKLGSRPPAIAGAKSSPRTTDDEPEQGGSAEPSATSAVAVEPVAVELRAADGVVVHGVSYAVESAQPRPIILLFHQAGSNAAEYEPIAPRLQALGYHALAIDQRSGKRRFGRDNLTVKARGESTGFGPAYRDLRAALTWARAQGHRSIVVWGSSYSAALVFRLAAEHGDSIAAVLAFSPGEYMGAKRTVAGWAERVEVPVFVTSAPGSEVEPARGIAQAVGERAEQHVPSRGTHGSSTLHPSRNPSGHREVWTAVEAFLQRVAP